MVRFPGSAACPRHKSALVRGYVAVVRRTSFRWISMRLSLMVLLCTPLYPNVSLSADRVNPIAKPRFSSYEFSVQLHPDTIIPYEQFWIRIEVTNVSDAPLPRPQLDPGGPIVRLSVETEDGTPVVVFPVFLMLAGYEFVGQLAAGESCIHWHGLGQDFWTEGRLTENSVGKTWRVRIDFSGRAFDLQDQKVESIYLPFTTIPAESDIDVEATRAYERAQQAFLNHDAARCETACRSIIEDYPSSRLVLTAVSRLSFLYADTDFGKQRPGGLVSLAQEFAALEPNSPGLIWLARDIRRLCGVDEYNKLLRLVATKSVNAPLFDVEAIEENR